VLTTITAALVLWIIGRWLIRKVSRLAHAGMTRNKSIIAIILNIALVMGILGYSGIKTTSFAALLAGAGVVMVQHGVAYLPTRRRCVLKETPTKR
jgi:small conductance mechanosensitive channel